ncbi:MAG: hypothetical protein ACJAV9_001132, partial [Urechidicola sp.]
MSKVQNYLIYVYICWDEIYTWERRKIKKQKTDR